MRIQPIVEGHGEVAAVPVLLRRLVEESSAYAVQIGKPIRQTRSKLVDEGHLRRAVRLALMQPSCDAILILFDADDDCPAELAPTVEGWARQEAGAVPCAVVMPTREYEAWFLAAIESLRGACGVRDDAEPHPDPEAPRGAKEQLELRLGAGRSYAETADQAPLTARFSMQEAYRRSRSFRRLVGAFGAILRAGNVALSCWPPPAWAEDHP